MVKPDDRLNRRPDTIGEAPRPAEAIYLLLGLFLVVASLWELAAAYSLGIRSSREIYEFIAFPLLPALFAIQVAVAALAITLGRLQSDLPWHGTSDVVRAWGFGVCVILFAHVGTWIVWETMVPVRLWWLVAALIPGLLLIALVVVASVRLVAGLWRAARSSDPKTPVLTDAVWTVGGALLVLLALIELWTRGLGFAILVSGPTRAGVTPTAANLFIPPILMSLGVMALASARGGAPGKRSLRLPAAVALAYISASVAFCSRLGDLVSDHLSSETAFGGWGTVGALVLAAAILWALAAAAPDIKDGLTVQIGGCALLLGAIGHLWWTDLARLLQTGSQVEWMAHPVCISLGCLGISIGRLPSGSAMPRWLRVSRGIGYLVGAGTLSWGIYHRVVAVTLVGVFILGVSLILYVVEVARPMSDRAPAAPVAPSNR